MGFQTCRSRRRAWLISWLVLGPSLALGGAEDPAVPRSGSAETKPKGEAEDALGMTEAVACRSIDGYEDYETLPGAALTSEEKLLVYYRPLRYKVERTGKTYHGHMTQDGQIRRRGDKRVLLRKEKLLDYEFKMDRPPNPIYLRNTFSLKGLKPGEYDYDIILHDKLTGEPAAIQTLPFRVIPVEAPKDEGEDDSPAEAPPPAPRRKTKAKR